MEQASCNNSDEEKTPIYNNTAPEAMHKTAAVPYKKLLLTKRMLITLLVNMHCASSWAALDPILEPELRYKVKILPKLTLIFI